jgi:hypothetical protein
MSSPSSLSASIEVNQGTRPATLPSSSSCNFDTILRRRHIGQQRVPEKMQGDQQHRDIELPLSQSQQQQQQQQQQQKSASCLLVLRPAHRYVDLVCIALSVLAYLLETTLNAALAIFGIGVGVGLVLGDSFRAALPLMPAHHAQHQQQLQQHQQQEQQHNMMMMAAAGAAVSFDEGGEPARNSDLPPAQ